MKNKNLFKIMSLFLAIALSNLSFSQDEKATESEFADYAVGISLSPFGGAIGFTHNWNPKTSFKAALGGFSGTAPINPTIDGVEYDVDNSTSWMGMFINHRPFEDKDWFRLGTGIGIGTIKNTLSSDGSSDTYLENNVGNVVGYVGIGFGGRPKKGLVYGLELGLLSTSGANVTPLNGGSAETAAKIADDSFFSPLLPLIQLGVSWGF